MRVGLTLLFAEFLTFFFYCAGYLKPFIMSLDTRFFDLSKCLGETCSTRSSDETTFAIDSTTATSEIIADILISCGD